MWSFFKSDVDFVMIVLTFLESALSLVRRALLSFGLNIIPNDLSLHQSLSGDLMLKNSP